MTGEAERGLDKRDYPERPIVGVAAVVVAEGSVLLIQRGKEPMQGAWSLPGGVLELGESISDGVMREVWEEAGIEVRPRKLVEVVERVLRDNAGVVQYHYILLDWLCTVETTDLEVPSFLKVGSDAQAAVWARLDVLDAFGLDAVTLRVIQRAGVQRRELRLE